MLALREKSPGSVINFSFRAGNTGFFRSIRVHMRKNMLASRTLFLLTHSELSVLGYNIGES